MLYIRHDVGVYNHPAHAKHRANHYWGQVAGSKAWEGKPWTDEMWASPRYGQNFHYLSRLEPVPTLETSTCLDGMVALRRSVEEKLRKTPTPFLVGRTRYTPPTLPIW
jgi:hypothetical protein